MDIFSVLFLSFASILHRAQTMSLDKHMFDAAASAEMFDLFHVMPDGNVKIYHELDMVLSIDQYKNLYMDDNDNRQQRGRYKRKARKDSPERSYKWPNCTVFYEVSEGLGLRRDRLPIDQAIAEWEKYTCLNFVESSRASQRIVFENGRMCSSGVGMQGGAQTLTLAPGCRTKGIVAHEIGHAIGWYHEHMRPDRDEYITVDFNNLDESFHRNYKKYNWSAIDTYNVGYSYLSLMHYGNDVQKKTIIKTKDPKFQDLIGQRFGLSFKDIKLANVMYDCAKNMGCKRKYCGNGFQYYKPFNRKGRCQCVCDSGNLNDPLKICSRKEMFQKTTPVPTPPTITTTTTSSKPDKKCEDMRNDCWERKGDCMTKMATMMTYCPKTCGFCGRGEGMCMDWEKSCGAMTALCNVPGVEETMTSTCRASCGKCAKPPPDPCDMYIEMTGEDEYTRKVNSAVTLSGVWALLGVMMLRLILML